MKIKQGFYLKEDNNQIIIGCDKNINPNFNSIIILTDTSSHLWNLLKTENVTKEQMLNSLLEKYDISTVLALNNIDVFVRILMENGIIEE